MPFASDSSLRHAVTDSLLRHTSSDFRKMGQRIFVFIIGGATRSEVCDLFILLETLWVTSITYRVTDLFCLKLRACHKLTAKLNREIVLGSTSLDDPSEFIKVRSIFLLVCKLSGLCCALQIMTDNKSGGLCIFFFLCYYKLITRVMHVFIYILFLI